MDDVLNQLYRNYFSFGLLFIVALCYFLKVKSPLIIASGSFVVLSLSPSTIYANLTLTEELVKHIAWQCFRVSTNNMTYI